MSMVNVYRFNDPNQFITREATEEEIRFINGCKALNFCEAGQLCYEQESNGNWKIGFEHEGYVQNTVVTSQYFSEAEALKMAFTILHSKAKDMTEQLVKYSQTQLD